MTRLLAFAVGYAIATAVNVAILLPMPLHPTPVIRLEPPVQHSPLVVPAEWRSRFA